MKMKTKTKKWTPQKKKNKESIKRKENNLYKNTI